MSRNIRTCLWFRDGRGREAADFYCSLIPGSQVEDKFLIDSGELGTSWLINFSLGGVPYQILDAGPHFTLTEAVSISVETDDQAETDRLWAALTANGGEESVCGWLKDRFGMSWQIVPREFEAMMNGDPEKVQRMIQAMFQMKKLDIAGLQAAYNGA